MTRQILAGVETEYGLLVGERGAEDQVDDSMMLVRNYPDEHFAGWDYRYESPRSDLRGFRLDRLAQDPEDAKFDVGRLHGRDQDIRSDRILPNGARFYNDHGHPEYATPECLTLSELAIHDCAGQRAVLSAARAMAASTGVDVRLYKNNTDFHGASYGTHESYLAPRRLGFERLFADLLPMMIARQVLVGAGKVGSESGPSCVYQLSQRADFLTEPANAETLYRRPIFNTRDEPHADAKEFIRLHVICGDANMISEATARKVGLIKLAIHLSEAGQAPQWRIAEPTRAFQSVSRDERYEFPIGLEGRSWTNAREILESYFSAAESVLELDAEMRWIVESSRKLLDELKSDFASFSRSVDWAAKRRMLESFLEEEGSDWRDPSLRSFDLEYHNVDADAGLHAALEQMERVEPNPSPAAQIQRLYDVQEPTRARARGIAVRKFKDQIVTACWRSITFQIDEEAIEVELLPDREYPAQLEEASDVGTFITMLRGVK